MDDVALAHRHGNGLVDMRLIGADRGDHLVVKQYRCECVSRAILEHAEFSATSNVVPWPNPRTGNARREGRARAAD